MKSLVEYLKFSDLSFRLSGFKVDMKMVWKITMIAVSSFFTVLKLDTNGILPKPKFK